MQASSLDKISLMGSFTGDRQAQTQDRNLLRNICIVCKYAAYVRTCMDTYVCMYARMVCMYVRNGKAIPVQAWTDSEGSSRLRFHISRQSAKEGGKVSPTYR
jgi:hypothetical protein